MIKELNNKSDHLGMLSSTICMIHCLLTPFLFAIKACSVNGCCASSPWWWKSIDVLFLAISLFAVLKSYQDSTNNLVKGALFISWIGLAFVVVNEYVHVVQLSQYVIYVPAVLLIGLHFINRKYCICKASCCSA